MELLKLNTTGPQVALLQSTLNKLGYYLGQIDSIFGTQTELAVKRFQRAFGIFPDGIVGTQTWSRLSPYIDGYTIYSVQSGDSIYSIAQQFYTSVSLILMANPNLSNPNAIFPGQNIVVPFGNVVPSNIPYSYDIMIRNLSSLQRIYPFLSITRVGNSVLGKALPVVRLGYGSKEVFYNASFHANEWITSVLVMKFIEDYAKAYTLNAYLYGYRVRDLFQNVSLYIIPMVNPDGVDLVTGAITPTSTVYRNAQQIANNYPAIPFPSGWKANIRGVDLNLQFPAGWENARNIKFEQGFTSPAPRDYVGNGPLTEPEALAVYNFTLAHDFRLVLAYHTQGKEIYWQFQNYAPPISQTIGQQFANASGYALAEVPYNSSFAGFKDWFLQQYQRPGYTIEAGLGQNPLPISQFNEIYQDNLGILILGMVL